MKSNKGFSLVELIIVIAIMAVLIGVLAPQFIKYVESSKQSTDIQNASEIRAAVEASECVYEGYAISVTVSLGCGSIDPAMSAEENIALCDRRLYIAKESGRNRVVREG